MSFLLPHIFWIECSLIFLKVSLPLRCNLAKIPFLFPPKSLVVFLFFITTVLIMTNLILVLISASFLVILVLIKDIGATTLPYANTLSMLMWHSLRMSHIILLREDSYRILYSLPLFSPHMFLLFLMVLLSLRFMFPLILPPAPIDSSLLLPMFTSTSAELPPPQSYLGSWSSHYHS